MKKRHIDFPWASLFGLVFVAVSLFLISISIPVSDDAYISFERKIENVIKENNAVYFSFVNDRTAYVFREAGAATFEDVSHLQSGDTVTVHVRKDYQEPTYAIIYKMEANGQVVYDIMEYHYHHNLAIVRIFGSTVVALLLTYLFIFLKSIKTEQEPLSVKESMDFIIKHPKGPISFGILSIVFGAVSFLGFLIEYLCRTISLYFFYFGCMFLPLLFLGVYLACLCAIPYFCLQNGVYTYRHLLRKQSIHVEQIDRIVIDLGMYYKVTFYDLQGEKAIVFRDNDAFADGFFLRSLRSYSIVHEYRPKNVCAAKVSKTLPGLHAISFSDEYLSIKEKTISYSDVDMIILYVPKRLDYVGGTYSPTHFLSIFSFVDTPVCFYMDLSLRQSEILKEKIKEHIKDFIIDNYDGEIFSSGD